MAPTINGSAGHAQAQEDGAVNAPSPATSPAVMSQQHAAPATAVASNKQADPSEVGWLFVPQYYLLLNQEPHRLHRFYTKKSTLIHGVEQEDTQACFGQSVSIEKSLNAVRASSKKKGF